MELDTDGKVYLPITARSAKAVEALGQRYATMLEEGNVATGFGLQRHSTPSSFESSSDRFRER